MRDNMMHLIVFGFEAENPLTPFILTRSKPCNVHTIDAPQDGIKYEVAADENGANKFKASRITRMPRNHF